MAYITVGKSAVGIENDINSLQGGTRTARLKYYAQAFMMRGVQPRFSVMSSPPTLTKSAGNASSVNASYVNNVVQFNGQDARLRWLGGPYSTVTSIGIPTRKLDNTTLSTGAKTTSGLTRFRFATDAEAVDFNFVEAQGLDFNLLIDGQMVAQQKPFSFANSGNIRWVKADFGANALSYALDNPLITPVSGGTGYAANDLVTLNGGAGGAGGTPARVRVSAAAGGIVTSVTVDDPGNYTSQPSGNFSQASTTGSGTGLTISTGILGKRNTTRKFRQWEAIVQGNLDKFLGIVLPVGRTLMTPAQVAQTPRILFVGDSITAGTYPIYAGSGINSTVAQMLGLWDNMTMRAQGGTGWNTDNGTSLRWSHASVLADIVAAAPDIIVFIGSQNDTSGTPLETAITATLNSLQASLPSTLFVGIGNIMGDSLTLANSIATGWAGATDQTRVRFINNHNPKWIPSSYVSDWQTVGDANHPHADAVDWFANMAAQAIGDAILDMTATL